MMQVQDLLLVIAFGCVTLLATAECKGRFAIQLVKFDNLGGLKADGTCCDGVNIPGCPIPSQKCDYHFDLCVTDQSIRGGCTYGQEKFNTKDNVNSLNFDERKFSLFGFDTWTGGVRIIVNVSDSDSEGQEPVDVIQLNYHNSVVDFNSSTASLTSLFSVTGLRSTQPTSLQLKVKVYCDPHWYGEDCSINCVAEDSCTGHYTCDGNGKKLCNPGWRGHNCDEQIPGDVADCTEYRNRTDFVPSLWTGQYRCSSGGGDVDFTLNISRSTIDVVADLQVLSVVIALQGSYGSVFKSFTLGAQHVYKQMGDRNVTNLEFNVQETASTSMRGAVIIDGEPCNVKSLTRTKTYFDGCNYAGSCVRYGSQKNNYYCCCYDGKVGTSCVPRTPLPTSTAELSTTTTIPTTTTKLPTTTTKLPSTTTKLPTTTTKLPTTTKTLPTTTTKLPTTTKTLPTTTTKLPTTTKTLPTTTKTLPTTTKTLPTTTKKLPTTTKTLPTTTKTLPNTTIAPSNTATPPVTATATSTLTTTTDSPTTATTTMSRLSTIPNEIYNNQTVSKPINNQVKPTTTTSRLSTIPNEIYNNQTVSKPNSNQVKPTTTTSRLSTIPNEIYNNQTVSKPINNQVKPTTTTSRLSTIPNEIYNNQTVSKPINNQVKPTTYNKYRGDIFHRLRFMIVEEEMGVNDSEKSDFDAYKEKMKSNEKMKSWIKKYMNAFENSEDSKI